jgi:hypothetical protein
MAASVVVGVLGKLREKAGQGYHSTRQSEGRRRDQRRERGDAYPSRNCPRTEADTAAPARKLSSLAARDREERGGERRGGAGLYRGGLEDHLFAEMKRRSDLRERFQ